MGLVDTTSTGWWIGFALAVVMSVGGFFAHFLTLWGSIAAFGVGFVVATSDAGAMAMLMTFFLAGSFATKFKKARKRALLEQGDLPEAQEMAAAARHSKSKGRTHVQVLATGGVPALLCLVRTCCCCFRHWSKSFDTANAFAVPSMVVVVGVGRLQPFAG